MIVCICRRISDRSLRAQIAGGARTAAELFRAHGCTPQCGSCVPSIRDLIGESRQESPDGLVPSVAAE